MYTSLDSQRLQSQLLFLSRAESATLLTQMPWSQMEAMLSLAALQVIVLTPALKTVDRKLLLSRPTLLEQLRHLYH
jgi:hypothetical protein